MQDWKGVSSGLVAAGWGDSHIVQMSGGSRSHPDTSRCRCTRKEPLQTQKHSGKRLAPVLCALWGADAASREESACCGVMVV
jgi:hypothetical protein